MWINTIYTTVLSLNALPTSSVIIPIVFPSGTGVIINGIVLMERMKITALILNVTVYSFAHLSSNACHFWMFVMANQIVTKVILMSSIVMQDPALRTVSVSDVQYNVLTGL